MRSLKEFAAFIRDNCLNDYVRASLNLVKMMDIPIMKLYTHLSDEQLIESSLKSSTDFLNSLENGTAAAIAKENLRKWEADELEGGLSKNAIHPSDLVLLYAVSKKALMLFIPKFTKDSDECVHILMELEDYFVESQNNAVQLLFKLTKEMQEKVNEKERIQAQFMDSLPVGITILDAKGKLYYVNEAAKSLFGAEEATNYELFTQTYKIVKLGTDDLYNQKEIPMVTALEGKSAKVDDMEIIGGGKRIPLEVWGAPVFDKEGKIIYAIAGYNDISERMKTQEELLRKTEELEDINAELKRSNRELEQFATVASHDLQEPIRTITSYLQLVESLNAGKLNQESQEFIKIAISGANRMRGLIKNLLEYSTIGTSRVGFSKINLNNVVDEALKNLENSIKETGTKVEVESLPILNADHVQMVQLFQNLVSNSIKFNTSSAPLVRITYEEKSTEYLFKVKDNGIGIDKQYQEKIFNLFQRLHSKEEYPGTGIGLAICKKIVDRHRGTIGLHSENGKGTTFYFTIRKSL